MQESKKKIFIVGYSGYAYVIIETINSLGHKLVGYIEPIVKKKNPYGIHYLGNDNDFNLSYSKTNYFFVAIGDNNKRTELFDKFRNKNFKTLNLIHPMASLSKKILLGDGNFIARNVSINDLCVLNNNIIVNTGVIIEHEAIISDGVHLAPGSVLCGGVFIGKNSFIGANSVIKEGIKVGENVIVGAGSVVIRDIPNNSIAYGNPVKIVQ